MGGTSGKASFAVGTTHKVSVTLKPGSVSASLDGKVLATDSKGINDGFFVVMNLDRYITADVDNFQLTI